MGILNQIHNLAGENPKKLTTVSKFLRKDIALVWLPHWGKHDHKPNTAPYINWYRLQLSEENMKNILNPIKVPWGNLPGKIRLPKFPSSSVPRVTIFVLLESQNLKQ